jgi:hypothetical protein
MIVGRKTKAGLLLGLLAIVSAGIGFSAGIVLAKIIEKKKEQPAFWKQAAMKHLEKLHPDEIQRKKFEAHTDLAVGELHSIQKVAIHDIWEVVNRAVSKIESDLTPEQRTIFDKIKPKEPTPDATP